MANCGGLLILASTLELGGGERVLETLAKGLAERGHPPRLLFLKEPGPVGDALIAAGLPATSLGLASTKHPRTLLAILRALKLSAPDLLYIQDHHDCLFWGRLSAALAGFLPALSPVHSSAQGELRAFKAYNRLTLGLSPHLATLGPWQESALQEREGVPRGHWVRIPNPVRIRAVGGMPISSRESTGPWRLITVAALRPEKRIDRMLDLLATLNTRREATLSIVGDGPERRALELQAAELGLEERVHFLGARDDVAEQLSRHELFLLTSDEEALPMSVLEAIIAGLPVAAPPRGAIPDLLAGGAGHLLRGESTRDWAHSLAEYGEQAVDTVKLSKLSAAVATKHAPERFLDRYLRLLRWLGME